MGRARLGIVEESVVVCKDQEKPSSVMGATGSGKQKTSSQLPECRIRFRVLHRRQNQTRPPAAAMIANAARTPATTDPVFSPPSEDAADDAEAEAVLVRVTDSVRVANTLDARER